MAFLHVPQAREFAHDASGSLHDIDQAVRATVRAMASALTRPAAEHHIA